MTTESVAPPAQATQPDIPANSSSAARNLQDGRTRSLEWRKQQLQAMERMMVENEAAVAAAAGTGPGP